MTNTVLDVQCGIHHHILEAGFMCHVSVHYTNAELKQQSRIPLHWYVHIAVY